MEGSGPVVAGRPAGKRGKPCLFWLAGRPPGKRGKPCLFWLAGAVGSEPTAPLAPRGPRARGGSAPAPLGTALAGSLIWFTFNLI